MKLSVKSLVIAAALLKALCFLFISLLNLILPPFLMVGRFSHCDFFVSDRGSA